MPQTIEILVINCGSSSLKFEWLVLNESMARTKMRARGEIEKIGKDASCRFEAENAAEVRRAQPIVDLPGAARVVLSWLDTLQPRLRNSVKAVAHRVVHGGQLNRAVIVDADVLAQIEKAGEFAPLHNPPALAVIRLMMTELSVPHVVLADTVFHRDLPEYAREYALPRKLASRLGIRRFGFHGIAHAWMMDRCAALEGKPASTINLITLQLGAGCSAAAIREGVSVDTSMGLTPLEGLMMGTRSGDVDPAIVTYLQSKENFTAEQIEKMLNHESGLLGVSELSGDMRELEAVAKKDSNGAAALAIEMFCYRVRKYIGAYVAALGHVDAVVFGGGIGEHSDLVRAKVCDGLQVLGIEIDPKLNADANGRETQISTKRSAIHVYTIPLDEELYLARAAAQLLGTSPQ